MCQVSKVNIHNERFYCIQTFYKYVFPDWRWIDTNKELSNDLNKENLQKMFLIDAIVGVAVVLLDAEFI
jgi:hypothetical protein